VLMSIIGRSGNDIYHKRILFFGNRIQYINDLGERPR
jgi:hypothetical protein